MISKVDVKDDKKKTKIEKNQEKCSSLCCNLKINGSHKCTDLQNISIGNKEDVAVLHNSKFYNISNLENGS